MSKHMTEWLGAYLDGELRGSRLHTVETHLAECQVCRRELQSLQGLSALLQGVPVPRLSSPERFAAQVSLRLAYRPPAATKSRILETGWWMIPVGLMAVWIFLNTSILVTNLVLATGGFGFMSNIPGWLAAGASGEAYWSAALSQFGILSGNSLQWAQASESFTRATIPQLTWQISIALLYLSWTAIWWARHRFQGHSQLLES